MEKLTKDIYIKHSKRIYAILNESSPLVKFLTKKDFASIVEQQLNVLFALEKKFDKEKNEDKYKTSSLVKAYNKATGSKFAIDTKFKLDDDADYIDNINYLLTYCSNIFKVNLDDLVEGKQVNVVTPNISFKQNTDIDDQTGQMAMGAMGMGSFMDPRQNPYVMGQATAMLQKEMSKGNFYRYKTKPKSIPKVKLVAIILCILTCLSLIAMSVFAFLTNGLEVLVESKSKNLSTITDGIFFILFAGIGVFDLVILFKSFLSKNENDKYYFPWQILLIFVIGSVLALLLSLNSVFALSFTITQEEGIQVIGHNGWFWSWCISTGFIVIALIPTIIGAASNPKVDEDALNNRMNQIIDQITSQFTFQPRQPQEKSADVQKPVEVKDKEKEIKKDNKKAPTETSKDKK